MFDVDLESGGNITMHRGDTGCFRVRAERDGGDAWTSADRLIFTARNAAGAVVLERYYRLDAQDLENGEVQIEFHNDDTDKWENGTYAIERRYAVEPVWSNGARTEYCYDALNGDTKIVEGAVVRTVWQGTMTLSDVYGEV